jgi:hypothetical protein
MNAVGQKIKSDLIYSNRLPPWRRGNKENSKPQASKVNSYTRVQSVISKALSQESVVNKLTEDLDIPGMPNFPDDSGSSTGISNLGKETVMWLSKASQVISDRAGQVQNIDEKKKWESLSLTIKNAIPSEHATDDQIQQGLYLLKQKIVVDPLDSQHLNSVKNHLLNEINRIL